MSSTSFSREELLAYLDEQLPSARMAVIEHSLRESEPLCRELAVLARERDQGGFTVGEVWRRERLSCPTRSQLGSFLLEVLDTGPQDYVRFHLETVGCRVCAANLADLQQATTPAPEKQRRRRKYFDSSAGYLRRDA